MPAKLQLGIDGPTLSAVGQAAAATTRYQTEGGVLVSLQSLPECRSEADILALPNSSLNGSVIEVRDSFRVVGVIQLTNGREIRTLEDNVTIAGDGLSSQIIVQFNGGRTIRTSADFTTLRDMLIQQNASNGVVVEADADTTLITNCLLVGNQNTGFSVRLDANATNLRIRDSELRGQIAQNAGPNNFSVFNCDLRVGTALANFLGQVAVPDGVTEFIGCRFTGPNALGSVETTQPRNFQIEDCTILSGSALFRYAVEAGTVELEMVGNEVKTPGSPLISLGDNSDMTINNSVISDNICAGPLLVAEGNASSSDKSLVSSVVSGNQCQELFFAQGGNMPITGCTVEGNRCSSSLFHLDTAGNAMLVSETTITGNTAVAGVDHANGDLQLANCVVNGNRVNEGHLLRVSTSQGIVNTVIADNQCGNDLISVINAGDTVDRCSISGNVVNRHILEAPAAGRLTNCAVATNVTIAGPFLSGSAGNWNGTDYPTVIARGNISQTDFG